MEEMLALAVRISIMYVFVLTLMRLSGKRMLGNLTALDFAIATIIGDMFDDVFWAEIPLAQAIVGITTIVGLHLALGYASWKSPRFERLINGKKTVVVANGAFVEAGMRRERLPKGELRADLRMLGEDNLDEIREGSLEPNGKVSAIKKPQKRTAQKQDLFK